MNLKTSKLRDAVLLALLTGGIAGGGVALAQESPQQEAKTLDTIQVTGSRIKSQTFTESSPVTEIGVEEFSQYGASKIEDLVNQYPQIDLSFDNFENNGSYGHATVSMRGLGPERTLTLVNGRRLPASRNEIADPSIIPTAAIKRVDILSGGASAVYGADAVAGVVNFVLDDNFQGVSLNVGYSAFQHNNDNKMAQALNAERGFAYPSGNSGFDGTSRHADLVVGSNFAEGKGHAMGWVTWRQNDPLYQAERDYSSCAVWYDEAACGGSGTANPARFVIGRDSYVYDGAGGYRKGSYVYNYAPINFYQRPDKRVTAGLMARYQISSHFEPYLEAMFLERSSRMQIAESGAFGLPVNIKCDNPLVGSLCADAGVTTPETLVRVFKRNVEGGPRLHDSSDTSHRITVGVRGDLFGSWTYDVAGVYGKTKTVDIGKNDFLNSRIAAALMGCNDPVYGTFPGCKPYNVWTNNVDPEAANAMAGTSFSIYNTSYRALSAEVSGDLGWGLPSAKGEEIGLAAGFERRDYAYTTEYDGDSRAGNFAGAGAADLPVDASNTVRDYFVEAALPIYVGQGAFNRFDASLGYRHSKDDTAGKYDTYKLGLSSLFFDEKLLLRAGYNRAVRAPGLNDLYYSQRIAISGSGTDLCVGATPKYTKEQCARAGVPESMYGQVPENPAGQYLYLGGGNPNLAPEVADTYTVGLAFEPVKDLNLALDWYNIKIKGSIGGIGYNTIQILCMEQGLYCDLIRRDARTGNYDLWLGLVSDPATGHIVDLPQNIGVYQRSGLDFTANYALDLGPGRLSANFAGNYLLKDFTQTLASDASTGYECKGLVNDTHRCQSPKWRHIASARYAWNDFAVGLRWRHVGGMDYKDIDGKPLSDIIWIRNGRVPSYNYLDLNGSLTIGPATVTVGVNNIADKEPPFIGSASGLEANANALGGYDQAGRFFFGSVSLKF